jgi:hypothetical protein
MQHGAPSSGKRNARWQGGPDRAVSLRRPVHASIPL